jgi:ribosomal protein S18 acetylase RimI-like enzyme
VLIQFLFIDKQYRGMGIASNLLKLVIDKYKKVFLVTDQRSSDIAKLMYKKYGFKIIDTRGKFDYWVN